jgi:hypothetical protein
MGLDFSKLGPYDVVWFRGKRMDARDAAMHLEAERRFGSTVPITQGGYNEGGVTASAGTHDGGGCLDWSVAGMSPKKKRKWDLSLKDTGWCTWLRHFVAGLWPEHQHGVARGSKTLAPLAADQVGKFDDLVSGYDDASYRPHPPVTFDYAAWRRRWVDRKRAAKIADQIRAAKRQITGLRRRILAWREQRKQLLHRH